MTRPTLPLLLLVLVAGRVCAADYERPWCKVRCGDGSVGSGTLVDRNDRLGLVVTAFHVVRDVMQGQRQAGSVRCEFTNGKTCGGTVVSFNSTRDLCAIIINRPDIRPVMLAGYTGQGTHSVFGFPRGGRLSATSGRIVDDTRFLLGPNDYPVAALSEPAVNGQSGGGVVTDDGLVGVAWGCDDEGHAQMTCGKPFDEFMVSLTQCYSCQGGSCWQPSSNYRPGGHTIISNGNSGPPITSQPPGVNPPTQPPTTPNGTVMTTPQLLAKWETYIQNTVNTTVENKIETGDLKGCECGDKDYVSRADFNLAIATLKQDNQTAVNTAVNNLTTNISHIQSDYDAKIIEITNLHAQLAQSVVKIDARLTELEKLKDSLDHDTPIRVWLPERLGGKMIGESKTNLFKGEAIDFTFDPRALLDQTKQQSE